MTFTRKKQKTRADGHLQKKKKDPKFAGLTRKPSNAALKVSEANTGGTKNGRIATIGKNVITFVLLCSNLFHSCQNF